IGLNAHLHKIQAADSPLCETCQTPETVSHYLLACRRFDTQRTKLRDTTKLSSLQIRYLLSDRSKHVKALMAFVRSSNRFPVIFGNEEDRSGESSQGNTQDTSV
ncbi:hypothetical protein C8J56DRAFT_770756, partial [Mycena floridula]